MPSTPHARPLGLVCALTLALGAAAPPAGAAGWRTTAPPESEPDPWVLAWEDEPAMDAAGQVVSSFQAGISRLFAGAASDRPGLAAAWEFPLGIAFLLVQHEVSGHGGRAREFSLSPDYGFGFDFSAYTTIDEDPESNLVTALLAGGGVESTQVLGRRVLLDGLRDEGVEASKLPLALIAKTDLTLYVTQAPSPTPGTDDGDFATVFEEGNDMVIYLVARQGIRNGADPSAVWNRTYAIDFDDPLLDSTHDDLKATALWNLLDPLLISSSVAYYREHLRGGRARYRVPALALGDSLALMVGTRGVLGPQSVSRYLDVHLAASWGVVTATVRDLDSSIDRTWGFGLRLHELRLGDRLRLSVEGEAWDEPESIEGLYTGSGWQAGVELAADFPGGVGVQARAGSKSAGHVPGLPEEEGEFLGLGVRIRR